VGVAVPASCRQAVAASARDRSAIYGGFHLYVLKDRA